MSYCSKKYSFRLKRKPGQAKLPAPARIGSLAPIGQAPVAHMYRGTVCSAADVPIPYFIFRSTPSCRPSSRLCRRCTCATDFDTRYFSVTKSHIASILRTNTIFTCKDEDAPSVFRAKHTPHDGMRCILSTKYVIQHKRVPLCKKKMQGQPMAPASVTEVFVYNLFLCAMFLQEACTHVIGNIHPCGAGISSC